ncbi:MAG: hypothetical protein KIT80_22485 [Chitinophagaceae bacterium]|nr:hypothetical protein [Chitinophagaceae bacterium]MCW5929704.1 hypothetical protein [Chitinophagaceae bacterium]
MNLISGFYTELRKSLQNAKRTAQMGNTHKAYSIEVCKDDGCRCSSNEVFVMNMERRATDIQS